MTPSNDAYAYTAFGSGSTAYSSNGLNQQATIGGAAAQWDANGNLTSDPATGKTYSYDIDNELTSAVSGAVTTALRYDPVERLDTYNPGTLTRFVYDGQQVAAELDSSGAIQHRYVTGDDADEVLVDYAGLGTTNRRFLSTDERGSIVAATDSSGNLIGINTYDEYGKPGASNIGRFQYTGQAWLPEAGVYDYKTREYLPHLGIFAQRDRIGYGGGPNLYAYVRDDPINLNDSSGLAPPEILVIGTAIVTPVVSLSSIVGGLSPFSKLNIFPFKLVPLDKILPTVCKGRGRGLEGNMGMVGKQGGIPGIRVRPNSAAVIPQQFGVATGVDLKPFANDVFGEIGNAPFNGITDVIGGKPPRPGGNVRDELQQEFSGQLILEIPGAGDQGQNAPVTIVLPPGSQCPTGTSPIGF